MMCQWFDCCLRGLSAVNNQQTLAYYLILPLLRDPVVGHVPSWAPGVSMWNILCLYLSISNMKQREVNPIPSTWRWALDPWSSI